VIDPLRMALFADGAETVTSKLKKAIWLASHSQTPVTKELSTAIDARAAASSPRSSSA
jgi:hypothetical protein